MGKKDETKFTVRINSELAQKLVYIAEYYGRSQNGQISWLVKQCITEFEKENGPIKTKEEDT